MSNVIHTAAGNVYAPAIKNRQERQTNRIQAGVAEGSITKDERIELAQARAGYRQDLRAAKADNGWVGPAERREAQQNLNEISASIYGFRHD